MFSRKKVLLGEGAAVMGEKGQDIGIDLCG